MANEKTTAAPKVFALGGQIVSTTAQARAILIDAIKGRKAWLIPQAESVLRQLRAQVAS